MSAFNAAFGGAAANEDEMERLEVANATRNEEGRRREQAEDDRAYQRRQGEEIEDSNPTLKNFWI